jgi:hypothetical protein
MQLLINVLTLLLIKKSKLILKQICNFVYLQFEN